MKVFALAFLLIACGSQEVKVERLKGNPGDKGADGSNGVDGVSGNDGLPGSDGADGRDGSNGVGIPGANGKDGSPGENGSSGPAGASGKSTSIRDTGEGIRFTDGNGKEIYWKYPKSNSKIVTVCICNSKGDQFEDTGEAIDILLKYFNYPDFAKRLGKCDRNRVVSATVSD